MVRKIGLHGNGEADAAKFPLLLAQDQLPAFNQEVLQIADLTKQSLAGTKALTMEVIESTEQIALAFDLAGDAVVELQDKFKFLLSAATNWEPPAEAQSPATPNGEITVMVEEQPFGMHVRRGTMRVEDVFPGFPARKAGVLPGCEISKIAGVTVATGTWFDTFRNAQVPFPLELKCANAGAESQVKSYSSDPQHYTVLVTKRPYGMNVQVNLRPRVVEVLPGFPAEAAGVRVGFVVTDVAGERVTGDTFFERMQNAQLPFMLTFDTTVPIAPGNPFFNPPGSAAKTNEEAQPKSIDGPEYSDFKCVVLGHPFGMQVKAPKADHPRVIAVLADSHAERAGVRAGDIIKEVAGRDVDVNTWFAAVQQAAPPYGMTFRRPTLSSSG
eukprot:NODE_8734_length_1473_cov_10.971768.p1 GENE.NODE_8734_length_1473_cov_10.971768~~NODE_8734_length_1473_cov_10.971768.p1  ORF type:complete len:423 (-),score=115.45 NODE_8734_length_1473_cov_10.971768:205-1356(-)